MDQTIAPQGPDPVDLYVGARIKARRKTINLSQEALGRAVGVTFQQVQKYERGTNRVSASTLVRIADALSLSPVDLLPPSARAAGEMIDVHAFQTQPAGAELLQILSAMSIQQRTLLARFLTAASPAA